MTPAAIFLGAIGTLTETSEIQRLSFNAAFEEAGLNWKWMKPDYRKMLLKPGGKARIARYAEARGEEVDAAHVHGLKVKHFRRSVEELGVLPRPGVVELLEAARAHGIKRAFVTSTGADTVELILNGLDQHLPRALFDLVTNGAMVRRGKPDPAIYQHALTELELAPDRVLAIEDTPESAAAAIAAGIPTLGFPGEEARGRDFPGTLAVVDTLGADILNTDMGRVA